MNTSFPTRGSQSWVKVHTSHILTLTVSAKNSDVLEEQNYDPPRHSYSLAYENLSHFMCLNQVQSMEENILNKGTN